MKAQDDGQVPMIASEVVLVYQIREGSWSRLQPGGGHLMWGWSKLFVNFNDLNFQLALSPPV